ARSLLQRGPEWVLAHSVVGEDDDDADDLVTLLVGRDRAWRLRSPRLFVDVAGTGDVLTALMATFLLRGEPPHRAAERAVAGVHATLESTLANGWGELDVQAAPAAALAADPARFPAVELWAGWRCRPIRSWAWWAVQGPMAAGCAASSRTAWDCGRWDMIRPIQPASRPRACSPKPTCWCSRCPSRARPA